MPFLQKCIKLGEVIEMRTRKRAGHNGGSREFTDYSLDSRKHPPKEQQLAENELEQALIHLDMLCSRIWVGQVDYSTIGNADRELNEGIKKELNRNAVISIILIEQEILKHNKVSETLENSLNLSLRAVQLRYGSCELQ